VILLVLAALFLGLVTSASGQRRGPPMSPGGYVATGRTVSATRPALGRTATQGGTVVIAVPVYQGGNLNEESGTYSPADGNPVQASTNIDDRPPVVINQNFASPPDDSQFANRYPANGREFGPPESRNPVTSCASTIHGTPNTVNQNGRPTIYLIAFKDHHIMQALGYWTEGSMLHYVSVEYAFNHASISLIDSELSQRLNHERGLAFTITGLD
jgi:hypothetical protein